MAGSKPPITSVVALTAGAMLAATIVALIITLFVPSEEEIETSVPRLVAQDGEVDQTERIDQLELTVKALGLVIIELEK